jgi:hypothetical protein
MRGRDRIPADDDRLADRRRVLRLAVLGERDAETATLSGGAGMR